MKLGNLEDFDVNNLEHKDSSKYVLYPGDVFRHICDALDALSSNASTELLWGTLLHDIGKPEVKTWDDKKKRLTYNAHDVVGASIAKDILTRFKFSNDSIDTICSLVANHMKFCVLKDMKKSTFKRFAAIPNFNEHLELHRVDCLSSHGSLENFNYAQQNIRLIKEENNGKIELPKKLINGKDLIELGYKPSPKFKEILEAVETEQLEGSIKTKEEALTFLKERSHLWKT